MTDSDTERTRAAITEFARLMYMERDVATAFDRYVSDEYIQHNAMLPDGSEPARTFLTGMYGNPESTFELQRIVVDGDLAALHVRAHPAGRPLLAVADFYRFVDGKIVEHWDVIQEVPATAASDHPMF